MTKILNHINTYADLTAYDNDKEKDYPNVSYLVATDEVKWNKYNPDHIVCKYNVTSTSEATELLNSNTGITYQIIDGVKQDTVQMNYTFDTLGEHIVEYKLDGTSIGASAFQDCTGLTSITIPDSVTSIDYDAFQGCEGLTSVTIGNGVTRIGESAFGGCEGLTSIVVDSANTVYDSRNNCNALIKTSTNKLIRGCNNTVIPNSVTSIGNDAFRQCSGLTSITIPDSVTSIGESAFQVCTGLTSITIPDSVTSIGFRAFSFCTGLTSVTIGSGVTSIGDSAFQGCTSLTNIVVDSANNVYDSRNNCNALIKTSTNELIKGCKNTVIPSSVTSIEDAAFRDCENLTSITIPNGVTSIGETAFFNCTGLTSITIPDSVTSIGSSAFQGCKGLTSVTIQATTPPTLGSYVFGFYNYPIYVPAESLEAYKTATNWSSLASRIKPIS